MQRQSLFFLMVILLAPIQSIAAWRSLAPGIDYLKINAITFSRWSHIHVFRINPQLNQLDLVMATDLGKNQASIKDFAEKSHALIAVNGGFFDQQGKPLGLRIRHSQQRHPLKPISWWGVFYVKNQKPQIVAGTNKVPADVEFAVQAGPRLIINDKIPRLKPGYAERTALGVDTAGNILLVITENTPMTTTELAERMHTQPIKCTQALNLDGGSSTQLYAELHGFNLFEPGFANISDSLVVTARR